MRIIVKSKAPPPIDPATIAVCDVDGAEIFQNDQIKLNNSWGLGCWLKISADNNLNKKFQ